MIVAARDEALWCCPTTLAALLGQTDPPDRILIADDGSTRRHAEACWPPSTDLSQPASRCGRDRRARICIGYGLSGGGKARAMNTALPLIDTDVVITVDADTLLQPSTPSPLCAAPSPPSPGLVATTGVLTPVCAPTVSGRVFAWFQTYEYVRNFLSRYAWMRLDSLLLISGAFAGFRRTGGPGGRRLRSRLSGRGL